MTPRALMIAGAILCVLACLLWVVATNAINRQVSSVGWARWYYIRLADVAAYMMVAGVALQVAGVAVVVAAW